MQLVHSEAAILLTTVHTLPYLLFYLLLLTFIGDLRNSHSFRGEVFIKVKEVKCRGRELVK